MIRLAVKGIGVTGGFGCGVASLAEALASGVSRVERVSFLAHGTQSWLPAFRASTERLEEFAPPRALRRMDRFSRLGLLGAFLALEDAGISGSELARVGVIVASGHGATATTLAFLDSMDAGGDLCASPTHFANSVHNAVAANISILLGVKGPTLTVSQFEISVPSALITARSWLAEGRVDAVLLGGVDELSELIGYLRHRQFGGGSERVLPLDFGAESSVAGEGAAFLLLTADDGGGYCAIDSVAAGNSHPDPARMAEELPLSEESLLVLGADGRRELGERYRAAVTPRSRLACYAPLYGTMPAASAFDLACAALLLREGKAFAIPGAAGCDLQGNPVALEADRVSVLRFAGGNEFSCIGMSRL